MKSYRPFALPLAALMLLGVLACTAHAQSKPNRQWLAAKPTPQWIWSEKNEVASQQIWLRKTFELSTAVSAAPLYSTCDNRMTLWINGQRVANSDRWEQPTQLDVAKYLKTGRNVIAVEAKNDGGIAALVLKLTVNPDKPNSTTVVSDASWKLSTTPPADGWQAIELDESAWQEKPKLVGKLGSGPWGIPGESRGSSGGVTDPADLNVAEGFAVDLIYTVPKEEQGSWVVLANGPNGTLLACDQGGKGVYSVAVNETADGPQATVTAMNVPAPDGKGTLSGAQGLLWAFNKLWFHRNGGHLYRSADSNGDGVLDTTEQLPSQTGGGEHGNHALILSADGKSILMDGGNHAPLHTTSRSRVVSWEEDQLLSRMWDANGHARGKLAPGGWVTRLNPETLEQELICIGFRNQYDIALNRNGDIFTYDADMEWDLGSPWYRPTRICQVVSGGDFGWRSGTGKWPAYYEDSLPPVVDIGPGSPTGVASGMGAKFPVTYQDAIFALDWTFGTIYAIHMQPQGAGYTGVAEPFVTGIPLPVTDAVVGHDGHLYFTVGGRGAQSGLYRVRYSGSESTAMAGPPSLPSDIAEARAARDRLEAFHGREDAAAIEAAWPHLRSDDRFLRHAARVAIESQPVDTWADRAVKESDPQSLITAAVALARTGSRDHQRASLESLLGLDFASLSRGQQLGLLRAYALTFIRNGRPDEDLTARVVAQLDPQLPSQDDDLNTELVRVLVYLEAPGIVGKTMRLITERDAPTLPDWSEIASRNAGYGGTVQKLLDNPPPMTEIGFALMLRELRSGWTIQQRRDYFQFLNAAAKGSGGASFPGFLTNIRNEALGNCSDAERAALVDITGESFNPVPDFEIKPIVGPGKKWDAATAMRESSRGFKEANFESGRSLYFATSCGNCHRFNGLGGNIGPDLTSIRNKFDVQYVVEHIIEPSKIISDQYQSSVVLTADGRALIGLVSEEADKVVVYPADAKAEPITLAADDVEEINPSPISQMPAGLIDGLNAEELRDLLAYLMSGGDPNNRRVYGK